MTEQTAVSSKKVTEYEEVTMADDRVVKFAGKRKVNKETIIDPACIAQDGDLLQLTTGAIKLRMDFRNGETRLINIPLSLLARFAGHGAEQKYGDELASPADKPLTVEDMVVAIDDLDSVIQSGSWGRERAAGGGAVSGASVVVQAIMQVTGKDAAFVKAFLQKKLDADPALTRRALYDSFSAEGTKTCDVIRKLEAAKSAKNAKVDANAELEAMGV